MWSVVSKFGGLRVRGRRRVLVNREHNGQLVSKIWGYFEKYRTLVKGFADKLVLLNVELSDCLFEVTNTAMNELCGPRRRACESESELILRLNGCGSLSRGLSDEGVLGHWIEWRVRADRSGL